MPARVAGETNIERFGGLYSQRVRSFRPKKSNVEEGSQCRVACVETYKIIMIEEEKKKTKTNVEGACGEGDGRGDVTS